MTTRYHVARMINAPAQKVWDLLTDADSYKHWNDAVISIRVRSPKEIPSAWFRFWTLNAHSS